MRLTDHRRRVNQTSAMDRTDRFQPGRSDAFPSAIRHFRDSRSTLGLDGPETPQTSRVPSGLMATPPPLRDQMVRELDAYRAADSRLAGWVLLSVIVIFGVLFAVRSRTLLLPAILAGGAVLATASYYRYRRRVCCPQCGAYAMPPFYAGEPQQVLNNFCWHCGAEFLTPGVLARPITPQERESYWKHRRNFLYGR